MSAARARIDGRLRRTPILRSQLSTVNGPVDVVFKLEYLQFGGCFKVRGSLNAIVHAQRDGRLTEAGVLVASGGNAAIGAAWAAQLVGTACTVVVPTTAPEVKVNVLRSLGAQVHLVGDRYAHAAQAALGLAQERGALALHAYDLPDVVAGAGTIGLRQAIDAGRPAGTGGPRQRGVGFARRHPARRDLLGTRRRTIRGAQRGRRRDDILAARADLWRDQRIITEHGTAAAVAAVTTGQVRPQPDSTLCIVLCGANTALDL